MSLKKTKSEQLFDLFNILFMVFFALLVIVPFIYLIMVSLTNLTNFKLFFHPTTKWSLISYKTALTNKLYLAFLVSFSRTVAGTLLNIIFTAMLAYVISRESLPGKNFITILMVITMIFGAGLIPSYLLITVVLKLRDSFLVYLLPGLISTYYCILLRNAFQRVPASLGESVKIDGGSDWHVLFNVMLPSTKPALATISLFYAVGHWNAWFDAILYINNPDLYTMQVVLRSISVNNELAAKMGLVLSALEEIYIPPESIIAATLILTTLPIVMVYPFLQRYFVKGIVMGAVKE